MSESSSDEEQNHCGLKESFEQKFPVSNFLALKWSLFGFFDLSRTGGFVF
jgi:hypothetical protein